MEIQDYFVVIVLIILVASDVFCYFHENENDPKSENSTQQSTKKYPQNNLHNYLPVAYVSSSQTRILDTKRRKRDGIITSEKKLR